MGRGSGVWCEVAKGREEGDSQAAGHWTIREERFHLLEGPEPEEVGPEVSAVLFPIMPNLSPLRTHTHTHKVLAVQSCPLFAIPWTVAHQATLSMGFSRQ